MVNVHEEALACFYKTDLDILVIENFIIKKNIVETNPLRKICQPFLWPIRLSLNAFKELLIEPGFP